VQLENLDQCCTACALAGAAGRPGTIGGRKLSRVTAQPTEDPADPLVILRDLPERERTEFPGCPYGTSQHTPGAELP
jgi:hypothetical protein